MARYSAAQWRPISVNYSVDGITPRFLVVHGNQGAMSGTDSWFRNPDARASAHFGIFKSGVVYQWVDTANRAWHAVAANSISIGVEMEMMQGQALTAAQVDALAKLFAWVHRAHPAIPLRRASGPSDAGLIGHSQGGAAWGGHDDPGAPVFAQFAAIIAKATGQPADLYPTLRLGAEGDAVGRLQERLKVWGAHIDVDGDFGPATLAAVIAFQKAHGLQPDGIVGPLTWAELRKAPPKPPAVWTFGPLRELKILNVGPTSVKIEIMSPSTFAGTPPKPAPAIHHYEIAILKDDGTTLYKRHLAKSTTSAVQVWQGGSLAPNRYYRVWVRACLADGSHSSVWAKARFKTTQ